MNFKSTIALLFVLTLDFAPSTLAAVASVTATPTAQIETAMNNNKRIPKTCIDKDGNRYDCP